MDINRTVTRAATAAALAAVLSMGAVQGATASLPAGAPRQTAGKTVQATRPMDDGGGWHGDGLALNATDNRKVDAFLDRARTSERSISPQVRAVALLSHAQLVGFDHRLKSPDSLKRKVATSLKESPGQTVDEALAKINDSVRYTLQWPDGTYSSGVAIASTVLSEWRNDSVKWSNTWGRKKGYKAINSAWRAPRSGQVFEVQFHTPESKWAQEATHKLYEEQRLPSTSPERARELQRQQDAIFASVPVPAGAEELTAPAPALPVGARRAPAPTR
ncbi:ATP nucleotide 3'-pyrophosphokinase [Streptomyces sp. NPDC054933]